MASTSPSMIRDSTWKPSQPIRFSQPALNDRRWDPSTPILFSGPPTSSKPNARSFSVTASRPAIGDRLNRPRPTAIPGARLAPARTSRGEDSTATAIRESIERKRAEVAAKKEREAEEAAARLKEEAMARDRKREADMLDVERIQSDLRQLQKELVDLKECGPLIGLLDHSTEQFKAEVRFRNIETSVSEWEVEAGNYKAIFRDLDHHFNREIAKLQLLREKLRKVEAEAVNLAVLSPDLEILHGSVSEFKAMVVVKNLHNLFSNDLAQEINNINREVDALAVAIVHQWQLRLSKLERSRHRRGRPVRMATPVFLQNDRFLAELTTSSPWEVIRYAIREQRAQRALKGEIQEIWHQRDLMRALEDELELDLDLIPGYEAYREKFKRHIQSLFEVTPILQDFELAHRKHLTNQEEHWHDWSDAIRSVRLTLHEASDEAFPLKVTDLMASIDTILGSILEDLTLFAAAFRYESLALAWHGQKFAADAQAIAKLAHDARREYRVRNWYEFEEPSSNVLAQMRYGHVLLPPFYGPANDWDNVEDVLRLECQWFPPSAHRQPVNVRKYNKLEHLHDAEAEHARIVFGPHYEDLLWLTRYAGAVARNTGSDISENNVSVRLQLSEFSCKPLAEQLFYKRMYPLFSLHRQVSLDLGNCLEALRNMLPQRLVKDDLKLFIKQHESLSRRVNMVRGLWHKRVQRLMKEVAAEMYNDLHRPEISEYLTAAAPHLHFWFESELAKKRANTPFLTEAERRRRQMRSRIRRVARENPAMIADLRKIDVHGEEGVQKEAKRKERSSGGKAVQGLHTNQSQELKEESKTTLTPWEAQWGAKAKKADAPKVSESSATARTEVKDPDKSEDEQPAPAIQSRRRLIKKHVSQAKIPSRGRETSKLDSSRTRPYTATAYARLRTSKRHRGSEVKADATKVDDKSNVTGSSATAVGRPPSLPFKELVLPNKPSVSSEESQAVLKIRYYDPPAPAAKTQPAIKIKQHVTDEPGQLNYKKLLKDTSWNKKPSALSKNSPPEARSRAADAYRESKSVRGSGGNPQNEAVQVKAVQSYPRFKPTPAVDSGKRGETIGQPDRKLVVSPSTLKQAAGESSKENPEAKWRVSGRNSSAGKFESGGNDEKGQVQNNRQAKTWSMNRTFKPTRPKQAPHSSVLSPSQQSEDTSDHHFDPTSEGPSGREDMAVAQESLSEAGSSDIESIPGSEFASDPESDSDDASVSSSEPESDFANDDEFYTPLGFQIPVDQMRAAMLSSPDTPGSFWSHKLYRGPSDEKVTVHYCRSKETSETVAKLFLGKPVLGFDIEWKPQSKATSGIKSNVSLIQLACEDRVGLFHIALHKGETPDDILPPTLRAIIASPGVLKTGVAILADFSRVEKFLGIAPTGLIELSHWHRLVTYSELEPSLVNKKLVGLAKQVEAHLQLPLFKGDVRTSDWSKQLNHEQCTYAAADAYASYRVYEALEEKRIAMYPRPPRPEFAELKLPLKLADRVAKLEPSPTEENDDAVDEVESLSGGLEKINLGSNGFSTTEESLTDEELLTIEFVAKGVEVEDLSQEIAFVEPRFEDSTSDDVKYPDLPPFEEDNDVSEAASPVFVGRVRLPNSTKPTSLKTTTKSTPKSKPTPHPLSSALSPEQREDFLSIADKWASTQTLPAQSSSSSRLPVKNGLRCYYLWYHANLDLEEVAFVIRDPPLKVATVANYIAEAVGYLGFEGWRDDGGEEDVGKERMRVVLDAVSMAAWSRYRRLRREVCVETSDKKGKEKIKEEGDDWIV